MPAHGARLAIRSWSKPMTTARDLLLQADALMRSNRNVGATDGDESVPLLTDVAVPAAAGVSHPQRHIAIPVLNNAVRVADDNVPADLRPFEQSTQLISPSLLGDTSVF